MSQHNNTNQRTKTMNIETQDAILDQADAIVEEATTPVTKKIKPVPTKPGTIGYMCVEMIYEQNGYGGKWTKEMTNHIIAIVKEEFPESKFQGTHVSYYRSVMKQNGLIA